MSDQRPTRDSMSIEEATVSNMTEIAAIEEVLERKGLCPKDDRYDITTEFRRKNPLFELGREVYRLGHSHLG